MGKMKSEKCSLGQINAVSVFHINRLLLHCQMCGHRKTKEIFDIPQSFHLQNSFFTKQNQLSFHKCFTVVINRIIADMYY